MENKAIIVNCGTSRMARGPGSSSGFSLVFDDGMGPAEVANSDTRLA
jgi:hypothetical protein